MAQCSTIQVSPGVQLNVSAFTDEEKARFEADLDTIANIYTRYSVQPDGKHVIADLFKKFKPQLQLFAEAAKNDLDNAGVFGGVNARNGFGMQEIRPDHIFFTSWSAGRTWDCTSGAAANTWYGHIHGATTITTDAGDIYMRKEQAVCIIGFMEVLNPVIEEVQWTINGVTMPVWNMAKEMRGSDLHIYEFPIALYLEPRMAFRMQSKGNAATTAFCLIPIGISFVTADIMRTQQPTLNTASRP